MFTFFQLIELYFIYGIGWFSINVQTVAAADLKIENIVARWPGSSHDQSIFNASFLLARLERGDFGRYIIVGDSGYKNTRYLATPYLHYDENDRAKNLYNESQIRTRNVVERSYGVWKRRFPVLSLGIRLALKRVQAVIVACGVLHNIAIDAKDLLPPVEIEGFAEFMDQNEVDDDNASPQQQQLQNTPQCAVRDVLLARYFTHMASTRNNNI